MDPIAALVQGRYHDPETGVALSVPVKSVVIEKSLRGNERELVQALELPSPYAVITDQNTHNALGRRVEEALGSVIPVRLAGRPHPDEQTAAKVMSAGAKAGSYVAVGSGTINDLAKFAAAKQGKPCAVFATAPSMNGYTSVNVAITIDGHKKSLPAIAPAGVFLDLEVLAQAPKRLIRAGFGDAICRSTAQCDWLMAHKLKDMPYRETPFGLFANLEDEMLTDPQSLISGDVNAIERLARVLILSGFGMTLCGGSYPASQGEHLISHFIEMTHRPGWDEPFHGEQIAVTTLAMAKLQETMISGAPPVVKASTLTEADMLRELGGEIGKACWEEFRPKLLTAETAMSLSERIAQEWDAMKEALYRVMRPSSKIEQALKAIGAPTSFKDLNLSRQEFCSAIWHAREIRNRYTFLDLAADSGRLIPERLLD